MDTTAARRRTSRTPSGPEPALAALLIEIAAINVWNRFNVAVRTPAGSWG